MDFAHIPKLNLRKTEKIGKPAVVGKNSLAFTLIELLVVVTIFSLLFGIGYANLRAYAQRQELQGLIRTVEADLRLAASYSLSAKIPAGVNCFPLDGYKVSFRSDGYDVNAVCGGVSTGNPVITNDLLSNRYQITATKPSMTFKTLGHGTDIADEQVEITITHLQLERQAKITVLKSGEIKYE